jgi:hypothetical protein
MRAAIPASPQAIARMRQVIAIFPQAIARMPAVIGILPQAIARMSEEIALFPQAIPRIREKKSQIGQAISLSRSANGRESLRPRSRSLPFSGNAARQWMQQNRPGRPSRPWTLRRVYGGGAR